MELLGRHPVALDGEAILGVALIVDVVRRVRKDKIHVVVAHESVHVLTHGSVPHTGAGAPPKIQRSPAVETGRLGQFRHRVFVCKSFGGILVSK